MVLKFGRPKIPLTVPGPSPWYLRGPWATLSKSLSEWKWEFCEEPKLAGLSGLLNPQGKTVLLLDFGLYVSSLPGDRLLVWYESRRERDRTTEVPRITFIILQLHALQPYGDASAVAEEMRAAKRRISFDGGNPVDFEFCTEVSEGCYSVSPPAAFQVLPKTLVLADYGFEIVNHFDKMFRAIFAFDFKTGRVSVMPQKWFNEGSYDFGYQWITRVQRELKTGQIVGEGIRIGNFRLDPSATQIQDWLHTDVFYHPEREF